MSNEVLEHALTSFESVAVRFTKDLEQLTEEDLAKCWGDSERCAYDFIYEVAIVNHRQATQLKGEDPGPLPWDFGKNWLKAPDEFRDKSKITDYFNSATEALLGSGKSTEDQFKAIKSLTFAAGHVMYHDGQLNFIQALKGDLDIHW